MALTLSQTGIETSNTVEAWHVTQSIDAFTGTEAYDITISGSLTLTGSINATGSLNQIQGTTNRIISTSTTTISGSGTVVRGTSTVSINSPFIEITDSNNSASINLQGTLTDNSVIKAISGTQIDFSAAGATSGTGFFRIPVEQTGNISPKAGTIYWDDANSLLYIWSDNNAAWMSASFV